MSVDPTSYLKAVEADALELATERRRRVKAQVMHDLSIITAGIYSSESQQTPEWIAARAMDIYAALKLAAEK